VREYTDLFLPGVPGPRMAPVSDSTLQVELLESSFALLAPRADELAERFYTRLFEVAPAARAMFPDDMAGQRRALIGAVGMIVGSLRTPEKLATYLDGLGRRHVDYGAVPAHYEVVGAVLLETMADLAGPAWHAELNDAWATAYGAVSGLMQSAAARDVAA
jgi:hemoglobin-like flavoprotein